MVSQGYTQAKDNTKLMNWPPLKDNQQPSCPYHRLVWFQRETPTIFLVTFLSLKGSLDRHAVGLGQSPQRQCHARVHLVGLARLRINPSILKAVEQCCLFPPETSMPKISYSTVQLAQGVLDLPHTIEKTIVNGESNGHRQNMITGFHQLCLGS